MGRFSGALQAEVYGFTRDKVINKPALIQQLLFLLILKIDEMLTSSSHLPLGSICLLSLFFFKNLFQYLSYQDGHFINFTDVVNVLQASLLSVQPPAW